MRNRKTVLKSFVIQILTTTGKTEKNIYFFYHFPFCCNQQQSCLRMLQILLNFTSDEGIATRCASDLNLNVIEKMKKVLKWD